MSDPAPSPDPEPNLDLTAVPPSDLPLVQLGAFLATKPDEEPPAEMMRGVKRAALLRLLPPSIIGVHVINLAELLLLQRRADFQGALKAADEEEIDAIHKQALGHNARWLSLGNLALDLLASVISIIPATLAWMLRRAPVRKRAYRYPWMLVSLGIIGGIWFAPCPWYVAAALAFFFFLLLLVLIIAGQFANAEKYEEKVNEIEKALREKRDILRQQHSRVSSLMKEMLENPSDYLEDKVDKPLLDEALAQVQRDQNARDRLRAKYEDDSEALAYIDQIGSGTRALANRRADARFAHQQREIAIERRMVSKRWSSTMISVTISSTLNLVKMWIAYFTLVMAPIVYVNLRNAQVETPSAPSGSAIVEQVDGAPDQPSPKPGRSDGLASIAKWGSKILFAAFASLFLAWVTTLLLRIVPRHRQMGKAAKDAMIDNLINDWDWHKIQLRLFDALLLMMEQTAAILGAKLDDRNANMVRRDRLESEREMRFIGRRLDRLTKKSWSQKTKRDDHRGGVVDSGAPEDLSDDLIVGLLG